MASNATITKANGNTIIATTTPEGVTYVVVINPQGVATAIRR